MTNSEAIVVGLLYPPEWLGAPEAFQAQVEQIRAVDPRIEVEVVTYVEPHEVRTARGAPADGSTERQPIEAPAISDEDRAALARIHVALAIDVPPDIAAIAPNLAWVQAVGSGTAHLQAAGLDDAGIALTSNGGSNSVAIAEFAFGRLIAAAKQFAPLAEAQAAHRWESLYGQQISGQTLGLIGYGAITKAVAARAHAFGMRVLVTRRSPEAPTEPYIDHVYASADLHQMLGQCDAVIAAVPETPETMRLMDADAFAAMAPGAFFANVGRGTLVDEPALIAALRAGHLSAAALDVTNVEPLPADDPLWDAPNLAISGHCSTSPAAMMGNLHDLFRANLHRFAHGEPLENVVSSGRGY